MEFLAADKLAVMDLASGEVVEDELSEDLVQEKIGGAGIAKALYEEHEDGDPLILGGRAFHRQPGARFLPGPSLGQEPGHRRPGPRALVPVCGRGDQVLGL